MANAIRPAAAAIAEIYSRGVAERSSTFETDARSEADILEWLADRARRPRGLGVL